jgi:transcriptional regulator of acetoin/glycerol metabolism
MTQAHDEIFDESGRQILGDVIRLLATQNADQRRDLAETIRKLSDAHRPVGVSTMDEAIRRTIVSAMFESDGNIAECARILEVERTWLYRKMGELGIR